jgi:hypothetical protein
LRYFCLIELCLFLSFQKNEQSYECKPNNHINGKYDRHATITSVSDDSVSIYGAVSLPVDYRGSFYAIGKDSVGAKLVYVKYRRRYRFVKLCELLRKGFCVEDDEE